MKKHLLLAATAILTIAGYSKADTITFTDTTPANGAKEFAYNLVTGLSVGPGFSNSNDNNIKLNLQIDQSPLSDIYQDVFLKLNPVAPGAYQVPSTAILPTNAATVSFNGSVETITQSLLVPDSFEVWTGNSGSKNGDPFADQMLLQGTISSIEIDLSKDLSNPNNPVTGAIKAQFVVYTGGDIYDQFPANGLMNPGTFTFGLSGVTGTFGTSDGRLSSFTADSTGTFDATVVPVPVPAAIWGGMALMGVLGGTKAVRRKKETQELI